MRWYITSLDLSSSVSPIIIRSLLVGIGSTEHPSVVVYDPRGLISLKPPTLIKLKWIHIAFSCLHL